MGDPAGVGPEVLLKALSVIRPSCTILGDLAYLKFFARRLRISLPWDRFGWIDLANVPSGVKPGKIQAAAGRAAFQYIEKAAHLLKRDEADALVTAPVSKEAILRVRIPWVGHTEFLGRAFHCPTVMMFVSGPFRVGLVTTHVAIQQIPRRLTRPKIVRTIRMMEGSMRADFGIPHPRIGLAALNPHAGEGGFFGEEERRILLPSLRSFRGRVAGPFPVDTLMQAAARGEYDAVVALYHDQALIPLKLIGWEQAVNVTLGLPFVRTSPVHGTAFDLAGKGVANPASMRAAISLAIQLARRRERSNH
jgi:4-hydroxythreonine-4-phosphate dehydrogenase